MRKILAISFVIILFANLAGYFISFTIQRQYAKAEAKELIKEAKAEHLHHFVFSEEEYQQLDKREKGREFVLNGGLYDVVRKEIKDGKVILTAYYDHKEEGLLSRFVSYFADDTIASKGKHILPLFSLLEYIFYSYDWQCYVTEVSFNLPTYSADLLTLCLDSESPPPDTFFC